MTLGLLRSNQNGSIGWPPSSAVGLTFSKQLLRFNGEGMLAFQSGGQTGQCTRDGGTPRFALIQRQTRLAKNESRASDIATLIDVTRSFLGRCNVRKGEG